MLTCDYTIVGGGIVGLSIAMQLAEKFPHARVLLLEKETSPARHQTGRNSGVIHSGIYYKPGSFKARFARAGARSMTEFCAGHDIPHRICQKLIVATRPAELPQLEELHRRARQNQVPVERLDAARAREIEPHVNCLAALLVKSTGITSYAQVARAYLTRFRVAGGSAVFDAEVRKITQRGPVAVVESTSGVHETRFVVNCAGLHSDRVARLAGAEPPARIVPFRGEYYELVPERRTLVNALIYPVPNPAFPFLGVHFTKMIDGSVHAGPNAVLAFRREGYRWRDFSARDLGETLRFGGFWKLARQNLGEGLKEIHRSLSKAAFVRSLQQLVPAIQAMDLVPCDAGVRAQALRPDGKLVDDFLIVPGRNALHVCNAPSPAATASLEIGRAIVAQVPPPVRSAPVAVPAAATDNSLRS
jgi:L-2-hydroxyglutarate oxidase